jgi:hypothetical protein
MSAISVAGRPYSSLVSYQWLAGLSLYFAFVVYGIIYFLILWGLLVGTHTLVARFVLNITPRYGQQPGVMNWMFFPTVVATGVYIVVLALGLPTVHLPAMNLASTSSVSTAIYTQVFSLFFSSQSKTVWIAVDVIQIAYYFGYLSLLFAIAFREMYDKSTTKALIAAIISGVICGTVFVLTRSSFGV